VVGRAEPRSQGSEILCQNNVAQWRGPIAVVGEADQDGRLCQSQQGASQHFIAANQVVSRRGLWLLQASRGSGHHKGGVRRGETRAIAAGSSASPPI